MLYNYKWNLRERGKNYVYSTSLQFKLHFSLLSLLAHCVVNSIR